MGAESIEEIFGGVGERAVDAPGHEDSVEAPAVLAAGQFASVQSTGGQRRAPFTSRHSATLPTAPRRAAAFCLNQGTIS